MKQRAAVAVAHRIERRSLLQLCRREGGERPAGAEVNRLWLKIIE
jgi:hypothetical protein